MIIRESPTKASLGAIRIEPQPGGLFTINSTFSVFTEMSLNRGLQWFPASNGSIPMILTGGTPLNEFPTNTLPPLAGQYITPPGWPELYPLGVVIKNLTLRDFDHTFPPPAPGQTIGITCKATLDFWGSTDGGLLWQEYVGPYQVVMKITGRVMGP